MKKHAKILGSLGVAAAVSMGIFAVTPVMAEDIIPLNNGNTSSNVEITVRVTGEVPVVQIARPLDGEKIVGKTIPVNTNYEKASELQYELIYVAPNGDRTTHTLPTRTVATTGVADGTDTFNLNLDNYGGEYGDYILNVKANGAGSTTDSVQFRALSFDFAVKGKDAETNDPIITIEKSPGVHHALFQVFDKDGNAILDNPVEAVLNPNGTTDLTIPLSRYGSPAGTYRIVGTPYDEDSNILDMNKERTISYENAPAPEVPETGFLSGLNLSRQDLISTGLALLIICGFFGILLIARKNKNQKRR